MAETIVLHQFCQLLLHFFLAYDIGELHCNENKLSVNKKAALRFQRCLLQGYYYSGQFKYFKISALVGLTLL